MLFLWQNLLHPNPEEPKVSAYAAGYFDGDLNALVRCTL